MANSKEKIIAKLNSMSADEVFEIMRSLNEKDDDLSFIVYDLACDIYMSKVPEETFCKAMDILDNA